MDVEPRCLVELATYEEVVGGSSGKKSFSAMLSLKCNLVVTNNYLVITLLTTAVYRLVLDVTPNLVYFYPV